MRFNVTIQEFLEKTIQIEASTQKEAVVATQQLYSSNSIVLSADDYVKTKILIDTPLPYYKSSNNDFTLIEGDCVDSLSRFNFDFDMVFADPPYFLSSGGISCQNGKVVCVDKGDWDKPTSTEDMDKFNYQWLESVREHMKEDATIWISGTHHNIFSVQQQLIKLGFKILNVITWAKTNPPPNISCRFFTHSTEYIIWARKSEKVPHYFNYDLMKEINGNKQMKDVWELPAIAKWEKSCGKHPTQKPLALLVRIILASTEKNAWILDPFSGSSTTGIAANLLGRNFLGIEQEQNFAELSKQRRIELDANREIIKNKINDLSNLKLDLPKDERLNTSQELPF